MFGSGSSSRSVPTVRCLWCSISTAADGYLAMPTPTIDWFASSRSARTPPLCSSNTTVRRRRTTRSRSSRRTRPRSGSAPTARGEGLDASRMAIAGDSVGGNMTAAVAIMAKQRGDVRFCHQSLYYPVTDAGMDTASYEEFAEGPFLRAKSMAWFWDAYCPDENKRSDITASPAEGHPRGPRDLPETFLVVDENDVLRDEGEAYARRLIEAGVRTTTVRYNATIHDFMMLNPLRPSAATTGAVDQATHMLRKAFQRE